MNRLVAYRKTFLLQEIMDVFKIDVNFTNVYLKNHVVLEFSLLITS